MKNTISFKTILRIVGNLTRAANAAKVPLVIIAMVAVIGFSMTACDNGGGGGGGENYPRFPLNFDCGSLSGFEGSTESYPDLDFNGKRVMLKNNTRTDTEPATMEFIQNHESERFVANLTAVSGNTYTFGPSEGYTFSPSTFSMTMTMQTISGFRLLTISSAPASITCNGNTFSLNGNYGN